MRLICPLVEKSRVFQERYCSWFPPSSTKPCTVSDFLSKVKWWTPEKNDLRVEELVRPKGLDIAVLRHKLRVIWRTANSKQLDSAERKVGYLRTETQRYNQASCHTQFEAWRSRQFRACTWLSKNFRKLKVCKYPGCRSPFFVREEKNQQYCSTDCASEAQRLQWKARKGTPKRNMTPEGSAAISRAVKKRWQESRPAKGEVKVKHSSSGSA